MFLHLPVILLTGGGLCVSQHAMGQRECDQDVCDQGVCDQGACTPDSPLQSTSRWVCILLARGYAWQEACMAGGMHGRVHVWLGACMAGVCMAGGHV